MRSSIRRWWSCFSILLCCLGTTGTLFAQSTGGRIIGRVADPTGAVLAGVEVTLINDATAATRNATTNENGDYNFVEVVPGSYHVEFAQSGFKKNILNSVTLDVNQVVTLNSTLQPGGAQEVVEVTSEAPQVDTTSTQLGAVINDRSVNELPLSTRDTYQFLQLQPGVQAQLGSSGSLFFGSDDPGSVSVNGGRTRSNNFSVNGGDANDQFANLPTIQPTPDSVAEFRVITNTFDAEYGRNSGSVVNVITKSGGNAFHGNVYEYFRNAALDAQGYFNTVKPQWNQNQFGGTFGGPVKKDRTFFFVSYEGRRVRQGQPGQVVNVPTAAEDTGDFSALAPSGQQFSGSISPQDNFVYQVLNGRSEGGVSCPAAISALGGATPAPGASWASIFPSGVIPAACQDPVAANLLQKLVPAPNVGPTQNQSVPVGTDNENQFTVRLDHKINDRQTFTAYYYFTDIGQFQPYDTFEEAGATIPGFGNYNDSRYQQWNLSHTWSITNALVNDAHFTYMREGQLGFLQPQSTNLVTNICNGVATAYCFTGTSDSSAINALPGAGPKFGITPGLPASLTGVPFVNISGGAEFGNNFEGVLPQVGNSFQWSDSLTWVKGNHTFKFGVDVRRSRFDQYYYYNVNGEFVFNGSGPNAIGTADGNNYAEFLLGLADSYSQGSGQREDVRGLSAYPFAQDSWKIRPNLTLNYGLRWEFNSPPTDISGHVETFRPGQNSTVYPCSSLSSECPTGLVVPGDPGVPAGMTSTYYKAFAPRIGLAYSPDFGGGFLGKLFGDKGKTSIRTGWGIFYNPIEELVLAQFGAEPPFGGSTYLSDTFFNTPFVEQNQAVAPNPYNGVLTPTPGQPVDLSLFRPILLYGEFQPHLRTQYTTQYNLTIQRELAKDLMLQIGYVGSEGHRLLASHDINASNPQTCLDINTIQGQGTCAPTGEDAPFSLTVPDGFAFHLPSGKVVTGAAGGTPVTLVGLRPYSSPNCNPLTGNGCPPDGVPVFGSIFAEDTIANSAYNALEIMLEKRFSHGLQFQAAYTLSKSLDDGSTFEETLDPFNFNASRGLSLFNSKQRFVISYDWELPIAKRTGFLGTVVNDWAISGITQFQSGFPIRLDTEDDTELINSFFFLGTEAPSLVGPLQIQNPKSNGGYYLNYNNFTDPPNGQFNNGTQRTQCCGPGLADWDFSIHKQFGFSESRYFQFRAEIFNAFNRTNFSNPDGHFSDGPTEFGKITQAGDPRLVQFALKFFF